MIVRLQKSVLLVLGAILLPAGGANGDESAQTSDPLPGVWKLEPRVLHGTSTVTFQEEGTMIVNERLPEGRYPIITRVYKRVVADQAGAFDIPGCEDKKECIYDEATEGIGAVFRSAFYVDYYADHWIDDLFTVKGNVMTADDGNGPIVFRKVESLTGEPVKNP